jgi:hypothetical protein
VRPVRRNQRWTSAEQNMLLDELRGDSSLQEIAARHMRSPGAICARLEKLLAPEQEFPSNEALFEWARSELCKGLGWAVEHADSAAVNGNPALSEPAEQAAEAQGEDASWTPARVRPATIRRRREVITIWSSLTGTGDEQAPQGSLRDELDVLAGTDDLRLREAGLAVLRSRGKLHLASWVLECDWPGIERLGITADQIHRGGEEARHTAVELLLAGLQQSKKRDREIMRLRLGLTDEAMTPEAIAQRFGLSRERIRQIQARALTHARVTQSIGVRRCWHHVHDTLLAALSTAEAGLDPDLVSSFVELATPNGPREVAVTLVARLCGLSAADSRHLVVAVDEHHKERTRRYQELLREERRRGKLTAKVQQLVDKATWPPGQVDPAGGDDVSPLRPPNEGDGRGKSGRWMSSRFGREIGYDSGAELRVIQLLDASDNLVASYCEQPVRVSYKLYGRRHDYYPDLLVDLRDGRRLLVEVKAWIDEFALYENVVKFKAATEFCHALGWGFIATTDRGQTPEDLENRPVDPHIEQVLHAHLNVGPTDWQQLYPLTQEHDILYTDIPTLVLRNGWYWHRDPYRLSTTPLDGKLRWKRPNRRNSR